MKAIVNVYSWLDRVDMTPSDDEADNLKMYVSTFLTQYSWLAQDAWSRRENLWSEVPKFHMLYHWMQQGTFMNPQILLDLQKRGLCWEGNHTRNGMREGDLDAEAFSEACEAISVCNALLTLRCGPLENKERRHR